MHEIYTVNEEYTRAERGLMDNDTELAYQLALQKTLERELITCEMMSERVLVRKEIRECKQKIKEVLILLEDNPTEQND